MDDPLNFAASVADWPSVLGARNAQNYFLAIEKDDLDPPSLTLSVSVRAGNLLEWCVFVVALCALFPRPTTVCLTRLGCVMMGLEGRWTGFARRLAAAIDPPCHAHSRSRHGLSHDMGGSFFKID